MIAVILAGGLGTRISEETITKPKPMVEIGGRPIIWHIMKTYEVHGISDFIICCGYKGHVIKEYFKNYSMYNSDVTFSTSSEEVVFHHRRAEDWRVTLVDTGEATLTGGRLKRVGKFLKNEDFFCFTYGDGVGNIDIKNSIAYHSQHGKMATVTAVAPPARFGLLKLDGCKVQEFNEKPTLEDSLINGGFFVLSPKVLDYIDDDMTVWEKEPLQRLAREGELMAHRHNGFWQPMDTIRDKMVLEELWLQKRAPWKVWS
jgi:glucose-1-phosphate cytidylyltransferase